MDCLITCNLPVFPWIHFHSYIHWTFLLTISMYSPSILPTIACCILSQIVFTLKVDKVIHGVPDGNTFDLVFLK